MLSKAHADSTVCPVLNPMVVHRQEGDNIALFNYNTRCLYNLSAFAGSLLIRCDGTTSVADLVKWAAREYGLDDGPVTSLIHGFLKEASAEGLVQLVPNGRDEDQ